MLLKIILNSSSYFHGFHQAVAGNYSRLSDIVTATNLPQNHFCPKLSVAYHFSHLSKYKSALPLYLNRSERRNRIVVKLIIALLKTSRGFKRDSQTLIGRTRHVTNATVSRIDWLASPKIYVVGQSIAEPEREITFQ